MKWHRPIPYSILCSFLLFQSIAGGGGGWALLPLAMQVTVVQPRFANRGPKREAKRPSGGGGVRGGGGFPSHCREIFENSGMKTTFSCTLNAITRG